MSDVTFTTPRGIRLSGTLEPAGPPGPSSPVVAGPGSAVLFAHGFLAERSSRGRADHLGAAYRAAGFGTLTFDFSGCGSSQDDVVSVAHEVEDLLAASLFLADAGYPTQVLHAHSLGALVSLRACPPHVRAMVLTGAVAGPIQHPWEHVLSAGQLAELAATGRTTVPDDDPGERDHHVISNQTLADFAEIDQEQVLTAVRCPVLLIHGGALHDGEEHPLVTLSRLGLPALPEGSALHEVPGAEHGLFDHLDTVGRRSLDWLAGQLTP